MSIKKILFLVLLGISVTGCNMQNNMLYFPDSRLPSESELNGKNIQFWPSGSTGYRGFVGSGEIKSMKGTIVVFHGNAGTAADRDYYLSPLSSMGHRVILAEYPGYGGRKGILGEQSFVNDAMETIRIVAATYEGPLYLLGESLGCGVVAGAAKEKSLRIDGIVLITPWNTLLSVAKHHYPFLPVSLFMKDKYDNAENLKSFQRNIAVVGAERDDIVPVKYAEELFSLLPKGKKMWVINRAGHNDWSMLMDIRKWQEIMEFLSRDNAVGPQGPIAH